MPRRLKEVLLICVLDSRHLHVLQIPSLCPLKVEVSQLESSLGLLLLPLVQQVHVREASIKDLSFTQYTTTLTGKVTCKGKDCRHTHYLTICTSSSITTVQLTVELLLRMKPFYSPVYPISHVILYLHSNSHVILNLHSISHVILYVLHILVHTYVFAYIYTCICVYRNV